ncbi:hypothetical protein [Bacillus sp. 7884-1]|uniref:hypothetical protein n=1 Tax=Bacillus sp. 7884-1 TaxID=2021693 RepID=UPI0015CD22D8|nr:hypothetical protein [Bacillus sp. 7884-1]
MKNTKIKNSINSFSTCKKDSLISGVPPFSSKDGKAGIDEVVNVKESLKNE